MTAVSEDSVTFKDITCKVNSNAYYCQTAKVHKPPADLDPLAGATDLYANGPSGAAPEGIPAPVFPQPEAGGVYPGLRCTAGAYTGKTKRCGHFKGLSMEECTEKCDNDASAQDKDKCDKKTGLPDCVASVYDVSTKTCILHRECRKLKDWEGHRDITTHIKTSYDPSAARFIKLVGKVCDGEAYTAPDGKKRGLKDTTEKECKDACFSNKWTGSRRVPVVKCMGSTFYPKTGYCDFFEECGEPEEEEGTVTFQKIAGGEDNDNDDYGEA